MEIKTLAKNQSLSLLAGINRPIKPNQVSKLAKSLKLMGNIRPLVVATISFITGKPTKYIIDGQHLYNALIRNSMPVEYVEIRITDESHLVEVIAMLNSSSKSWTMFDYIIAWSSINADYKKLSKYYHIYDFDLATLSDVLASRRVTGKHMGGPARCLKSGTFKIVDEANALKTLDQLTDVFTVVPRMNRQENKYVCSEYISFLKNTRNYDHTKFMASLKSNKQKLVLATQEPEKLSEIFRKLL